MELEVGQILSGKVTGIMKFGAFVSLAPGKSGLVHISEIANAYVSNVSDYLSEGQEVNVKIIGIDESGRINLSIKQTLPASEPRNNAQRRSAPPRQNNPAPRQNTAPAASEVPPAEPESADSAFETKLKRFMQDSDSKIAGMFTDHRTSRRRGNRG